MIAQMRHPPKAALSPLLSCSSAAVGGKVCESFGFKRSEQFGLDVGETTVQNGEARPVAVGDGYRNHFAGFEAEVRDFVSRNHDAAVLSDFHSDVIHVGILPNGYPVPIGPGGLHADRRSVLRVSAAARSHAGMVAA